MRRRILTEAERGCLERWLDGGVEDQMVWTTLSRVRRVWPGLAGDLELLFRVVKRLRVRRRWAGRVARGSALGFASRCVASALTRARGGRGT